jgi:hypothetical protein
VPQPAPPKGARAGITFEQQQVALQQQQVVQQQQQQQAGQQQQMVQQALQQPVQQQGLQLQVPCQRADHVLQCWHYCDDGTWKDLLVVFGGSSSEGLMNDTWLFDVNTSSWTQVGDTLGSTLGSCSTVCSTSAGTSCLLPAGKLLSGSDFTCVNGTLVRN